jgi:hypothetical protein
VVQLPPSKGSKKHFLRHKYFFLGQTALPEINRRRRLHQNQQKDHQKIAVACLYKDKSEFIPPGIVVAVFTKISRRIIKKLQ